MYKNRNTDEPKFNEENPQIKILAHVENSGMLDNKKTNLTGRWSAMISSFTVLSGRICRWACVLRDAVVSQILLFGNTDKLHVLTWDWTAVPHRKSDFVEQLLGNKILSSSVSSFLFFLQLFFLNSVEDRETWTLVNTDTGWMKSLFNTWPLTSPVKELTMQLLDVRPFTTNRM